MLISFMNAYVHSIKSASGVWKWFYLNALISDTPLNTHGYRRWKSMFKECCR